MDLLVKKVTTLPKTGDVLDVDSQMLASVKQACKSSADSTKEVFYYASMDLKKRSGAVRIRALLLMDCLVHRSKLFRELVCADVKQIAMCMGLLNESDQGPSKKTSATDRFVSPVTSFSVELENKGKELIEIWDHLYGDRHPQLRALARYLRETLRLEMPNIMENARLHAERGARAKQHSENLLLLQKDKVLEGEWSSFFNEWTTSLDRLEECFDVLFPRVGNSSGEVPPSTWPEKPPHSDSAGNFKATDDFEDVNWVGDEEDQADAEEGASVEVQGKTSTTGAGDSSAGIVPYTLTIQLNTAARDLETADNAVLVQTIRELSRVLARSAVPRLLLWKDLFAQCAALYVHQLADLYRAEESVAELFEEVPPMGLTDGLQDVVLTQRNTSSVETATTVLGKRAALSAALDHMRSSVSPAVAKVLASKSLVDQRLTQVISLLHSIRVMLTGKCRDLLKDEYV